MLSTVGFWDSFYAQKSSQRAEDKEWYLPSTTAAATVRAFVGAWERGPSPPPLRVLHNGCGTSPLGELIRRDPLVGSVVDADFSPVATTQLDDADSAADGGEGGRVVVTCDARDMRAVFADGAFDVVVGKGLVDAATAASEARAATAAALAREAARVLAAGGCWLEFSTLSLIHI